MDLPFCLLNFKYVSASGVPGLSTFFSSHLMVQCLVGITDGAEGNDRLVGPTNCSGSKYEPRFFLIVLQEHLLEQHGSGGGFMTGCYLTSVKTKPD
jgi:hypothetical protein